jgi:hypothetical protein
MFRLLFFTHESQECTYAGTSLVKTNRGRSYTFCVRTISQTDLKIFRSLLEKYAKGMPCVVAHMHVKSRKSVSSLMGLVPDYEIDCRNPPTDDKSFLLYVQPMRHISLKTPVISQLLPSFCGRCGGLMGVI